MHKWAGTFFGLFLIGVVFVLFEKFVSAEQIARVESRLEKYSLEILHDDGLYRHLYCCWKDDPLWPANCSFHILTAPGTVTIWGDWFDAYTLRREPDMLRDFLNVRRVDFGYWAEKLELREKYSVVRAVDEEEFYSWVWAELMEYCGDDEILFEEIRDDIKAEDLFSGLYSNPFARLLDMRFLVRGKWVAGSDIFDFEASPGEHYTLEWVRVCLALRWAAREYVKQSAS